MFNYDSNSDSVRTRTNKPLRRYGFENHEQNLQNEPQPKSRIRNILAEFCARSTIHGVGYFVDHKRHWIERAWWIIAIVASTVMCFVSIYNVWSNWKNEPIIVAAETRLQFINEIPFPAITICPSTVFASNKFNYTATYRLLRKLDGNNSRDITAAELKLMKLANEFCFKDIAPGVVSEFSDDYLDDDTWNTINEISPPFNDTFIFCKLLDKWIDCGKLFVPQITEQGVCYTFNTLNVHEMYTNEIAPEYKNETFDKPPSNWNQHTGYSEQTNESYPFRVHDTGPRSSLTVIFKVLKNDLDYLCSGGAQGFTASLHPPDEGPQMYKRFFFVPLQQTILLSIDPFRTRTIKRVRAHDLSVRQCYLDAERKLRFYKHYTSNNCRLECLSNFTLAQCGCVKFSMPRSNGTKVCGSGKSECYQKANGDAFRTDALPSCNCLESCMSLGYSLKLSQIAYNFSQSKCGIESKFDKENAMFSRLIVKFMADQFVIVRRIESLTFTDFYTKVGGIFSVCMGASLISFVELLYFVTLRLFFAYRQEHTPIYPYIP